MTALSINLIPAELEMAMACRRRMAAWGMVLGLILSSLGLTVGLVWHRKASAGHFEVQTARLREELERVRQEVKTVTAEAVELRLKIQRADALRAKRPWSGLIARIASCLPPDCWLASLATDPPAPTGPTARRTPLSEKASANNAASVTIDAPRRLRVSGFAPDAAKPHAFVANLKNAAVFDRVALERSSRETTPQGSFFRFDVVCEW